MLFNTPILHCDISHDIIGDIENVADVWNYNKIH